MACTSQPQSQGDAICNAYLNGFVNGILVDQIAREGGQPICIDNTNTRAVREAITTFLKAQPDVLSVDAGSLLGAAFQRLYPCRNRN